MNIHEIKAASPIVGKYFSEFLEGEGIRADSVEFKIDPPYKNEQGVREVHVVAVIEGKVASLGMTEKAAPEQFQALLDAAGHGG